ncbi:MAG TPA: hypothetical protein VLE97_03735 [Gaiellaceae bacterium]|nr:hypothetical protein [Gaiellaceae bacterium]
MLFYAVGEHWKRQRLVALADRDSLVAHVTEHTPRAIGERLPAETRERFRRTEARACPADEQDAGQPSIRHVSV